MIVEKLANAMGESPAKPGGWQKAFSRVSTKDHAAYSRDSSESSETSASRPKRSLILPASNSEANVRTVVERLAASSRVRRNKPPGAVQTLHTAGSSPKKANAEHKSPNVVQIANSATGVLGRTQSNASTRKETQTPAHHVHMGDTSTSPRSTHRPIGTTLRPAQQQQLVDQGILKNDRQEDLELDSSEEETDSSVPDLEHSDFERITKQWAEVSDRRESIKETFRKVVRGRTKLQNVRRDRNEAYHKLKLIVQATFPEHPNLRTLFQELDRLDLVYQEAELTVDDLIDEVEEKEIDLELEERIFFTSLVENNSDTESELSRTSSRETLRGIEGKREDDTHPLLIDLRSAVRQVQLAKKKEDDLKMMHQSILERPQEALAMDQRRLLDEFDELLAAAQNSTFCSSERMELLKKKCQQLNLIRENDVFQQQFLGTDGILTDEIFLEELVYENSSSPSKDPDLTHPRFGILLSSPTHLLEDPPLTAENSLRVAFSMPKSSKRRRKLIEVAKKELGIESLLQASDSNDKQNYINRWLLHRLRLSPMEAELLLVQFVPILQIRDPSHWQRDVLFYWSRDSTANIQKQAPAEKLIGNDKSSGAARPNFTDTQVDPKHTSVISRKSSGFLSSISSKIRPRSEPARHL